MSDTRVQVGIVIDEETTFTLRELCESIGVHAEYVVELVQHGVLEPTVGREPPQWRFPAPALRRSRRALRLQRDLELDLAGVSMALDLLDELEALRWRVRQLERRLEE